MFRQILRSKGRAIYACIDIVLLITLIREEAELVKACMYSSVNYRLETFFDRRLPSTIEADLCFSVGTEARWTFIVSIDEHHAMYLTSLEAVVAVEIYHDVDTTISLARWKSLAVLYSNEGQGGDGVAKVSLGLRPGFQQDHRMPIGLPKE